MTFKVVIVLFLFAHIIPVITLSERALRDKLLKNYSRLDRPVIPRTKPINVKCGFLLQQLLSVSESSHTIKVKGQLWMVWSDDYLTWNASQLGGIYEIRMNPTDVWTPDIYLMEDVQDDAVSGNTKFKQPVKSYNNGVQHWIMPNVIYELSCYFNVKHFPFDTHSCNMSFASAFYDADQLNLNKFPYLMNVQLADSEWNVTSASVIRFVPCTGCLPRVIYTYILRRKPTQFLTNILVPSIIQMIIIIFTFILPPESGERIGVSVTVLLVFAVYLEVIREQVPSGSTTTAVSKFYLTAMAGSALSTIATCFVLVIYFKGSEAGVGPVPRFVKTIFLKCLGRCFSIRNNMIVENHHEEDIVLQNRDAANDNEEGEVGNSLVTNEIAKEVRVITSHLKDKEIQDSIEEEWRLLAKIVDRLFFIVFFLFFTISSLLILLPLMG